MNQLKYTPDDIEMFISATGKDIIQQRRKHFEEMIENAQKRKFPYYSKRTNTIS